MGKITEKLKTLSLNRAKTAHIKAVFKRVTRSTEDSFRSRMYSLIGGLQQESGMRDRFEDVSFEEIKSLPLYKSMNKLAKHDPTISFAVTSAVILLTQKPEITSKERGQEWIDQFLAVLEAKKNPFGLFVDYCAASLVLHGNLCVELVFDESGTPIDLIAVDPNQFELRLVNKDEGQVRVIGQYQEGEWVEIDSPNVRWTELRPLIGELKGSTPMQSAIQPTLDKSQMSKNLQAILDKQAFPRMLIKERAMEALKIEGLTETNVNEMQDEAEEMISKASTAKPSDAFHFSDFIDVSVLQGAGGSMEFINMFDRVLAREAFQGANIPPTIAGSNEYTAESSARSQNLYYSAYLTTIQNKIKTTIEWAFQRALRSQGIADDAVFDVKSVDTLARVEESEAFSKMMSGIRIATSSGIDVISAIRLYEAESGNTLPADVVESIENNLIERDVENETANTTSSGTSEESEGQSSSSV